MTARVDSGATSPPVAHRPRFTARRLTAVASHAYIWLCLFLFVLPFAALVLRSLAAYGGSAGLENYRGAIGDFSENLFWSVKITALALVIDLAVSLPAAYALVRYPIPGRRIIFSILQLSLYVPGRRHRPVAPADLHVHLSRRVDVGPRAGDGGRDVPVDADPDRGGAEGPAPRVRGGRRDASARPAGRRTGRSCSR